MAKEKDKRKEKITKELGLPDNVDAILNGQFLTVKGPKGDARKMLKGQDISIKIEGKKIVFESNKAKKIHKKIVGSMVAHVKNMIRGSLQNHVYTLKICSGHFPMNVSVSDNKIVIKNFLGEKVPRVFKLKDGANVKVEGDLIYVTSPDKEIAGQVSADIEQLTRRPGYDTRIFQDGIWIVSKDGKELK